MPQPAAELPPAEFTTRDRIPVTTAARTILDLADAVGSRALERMLDEAERLRLCTDRGLAEALSRHRGRPGSRLLAAVLELKDVPLLTGTMTMDPETRLPVKPITLVKMEGTEFTLLEEVIPSYIAPVQ